MLGKPEQGLPSVRVSGGRNLHFRKHSSCTAAASIDSPVVTDETQVLWPSATAAIRKDLPPKAPPVQTLDENTGDIQRQQLCRKPENMAEPLSIFAKMKAQVLVHLFRGWE